MKTKKLLTPYRITAISLKKFLHDDCLTMSSSVSFAFLLSIIPFATLNMFIFNLIQRIIFPESVLADTIRDFLAREMVQFFPLITEEWVKTYIIYSNNTISSFRVINFVLLPIVSGLVFKTLESSYRKIFHLPTRHLLLSQALYALLTIFIVLLLFITSFTWNIISTPLMRIISLLNEAPYFSTIDTFLNNNPILPKVNFLSVFLILFFYFATVKIFLPQVKIKRRYKLFSGVVFFLLWLFAREIFQMYIEHISKVNLLYGSLSSIIIILLWMFYSALALLFSIELLYVLHAKEHKK